MTAATPQPKVQTIVGGDADGTPASQSDLPSESNAGVGVRPAGACAAPPDLLSEYVRKDELAQQFGVSERTIERWVRLRMLPAPVRLGRTSLYHLPTIQKHLARQLQSEPGRRRLR